jgi:hypothetical protein
MKVYCEVEDRTNYTSKGLCKATTITITSDCTCEDFEEKDEDDVA